MGDIIVSPKILLLLVEALTFSRITDTLLVNLQYKYISVM